MQPRGGLDVGEELRAADAVNLAAVPARDEQAAALLEQPRPGLALQFAPDRVRALRQRRVVDAFADGGAGDAGLAMGRAEPVRRLKAVDAEHVAPRLGEMQHGGTADRAAADHDHIKLWHTGSARWRRLRSFLLL